MCVAKSAEDLESISWYLRRPGFEDCVVMAKKTVAFAWAHDTVDGRSQTVSTSLHREVVLYREASRILTEVATVQTETRFLV